MTPNTKIISRPWSLMGSGYILLYRFNKEFINAHGFLANFQKEKFKSGWGAMMLVDYQTSPVGPYHELLFIPGLLSFRDRKVFSISKIYVSAQASVVNGIANWGMPKEQADFSWMKRTDGDFVRVAANGITFFEADFKKKRFRFPISTKLFPITIVQEQKEQFLLTKPSSKGIAYLAKMSSIKINPTYFPDLSLAKPLITIKVENFKMEFPLPNVYDKMNA
jgi:hypothetical protein